MSTTLFELRDATVLRGRTRALDGVSIRVSRGEHVAIIGPNGSGKSTLLRTLTRECVPLYRERAPPVIVLGEPRQDLATLRQAFGVVASDLTPWTASPSAADGMAIVLSGFFGTIGLWPHQPVSPAMRARAATLLDQLGVAHVAARALDTMSAGEARRVMLARALVHDPCALLLDEPTTGLDIAGLVELRRALRAIAAAGTSIVLVTHGVSDLIPEIGRTILMQAGRIVADGPTDAVLTGENLTRVLGATVTVGRTADGWYLRY